MVLESLRVFGSALLILRSICLSRVFLAASLSVGADEMGCLPNGSICNLLRCRFGSSCPASQQTSSGSNDRQVLLLSGKSDLPR